MKFSLVTETFPPEINGVAMTLDRLVRGLQKRGAEVTVFTPWRKERDNPTNWRLVPVRGMPIPQYPELRLGLPAGRKLMRIWKEDPPDIVHIATEGFLGWSALKAANRLGIPVISSFHTNFHSYGNHYGLGLLKPAILRWLKYFHNRSARTFVPSLDLIDQLMATGFRNLRLFDRGVDSELFGPHRRSKDLRHTWGAEAETPVALYVGRIAPEKNLQLLERSYRHMRASLPDLKLVIVGDGPDRTRLQEALPEAHFSGTRSGVTLAKYYASADCFIFPSTSETFGNVVTEAMCSALPVLAFNYAAPARFIQSGSNGILVRYMDENRFMEGAEELVSQRLFWPRMGEAAREAILPCSWDSVINAFWQEVQPVLLKQTA